MYDADQLFVEYTRRRKRDIQPTDIIQDLRPHIKLLSDEHKQALKARIRKWETEYVLVPADGPPPPQAESDRPSVRRITLEAQNEEQDAELIETICNHCGRANRAGEAVCYGCGKMLDTVQQFGSSTRILHQTSDLHYSDEFFGDDFILSIKVRGATETDRNNIYEIRPQDMTGELFVGRYAEGQTEPPDIDLADHDAEERGVSRMHLSLLHDLGQNVIHVRDCGSANGTFINGQRLHANEVRVLRNGDEVRLGRLVLSMKFYTYGF